MKCAALAILACFFPCSQLAASSNVDEDKNLIVSAIEHLNGYLKNPEGKLVDLTKNPEVLDSLKTGFEEWKIKRDEERSITTATSGGWFASVREGKKIELSYGLTITETEVDEYSFYYNVEGQIVSLDNWGISMLHLSPFEENE